MNQPATGDWVVVVREAGKRPLRLHYGSYDQAMTLFGALARAKGARNVQLLNPDGTQANWWEFTGVE